MTDHTSGTQTLDRPPLQRHVVALVASLLFAALGAALFDLFGLPLLSVAVGLATLCALALLRAGLREMQRRAALNMVRTMGDTSPGAVIASDLSGQVVYANPVAQDSLGATSGRAFAGLFLDQCAAPAQLVSALLAEAREAGHATRKDFGADGRTLSVSLSGNVAVWRLSPDNRNRNSPQPIEITWPSCTVGPSGQITHTNAAFVAFMGRRPLTLDDALVSAGPPRGTLRLFRTRTGQRPAHLLEISHNAGDATCLLVPEARVQNRPAALLDGLPVPAMELTRDGTVAAANQAARELLGLEPGQYPALSELVLGLGKPLDSWFRDTAALGKSSAEVVRCARVDGERFVQITLSAGRSSGDDGFTAILQDATEVKSLEAQIAQSQKMQSIGLLAGGIAHDFNNLLTAIGGHCDLLLMRHKESDSEFPDLEQISQNANRAASLVEQLLAFSRKQTLSPDYLDLRDLLSDMSHLLGRLVGEHVAIEVRHDPNIRLVRADKRQLEQVILNLVVNASDAMPDGGGIRIISHEERLDQPLQRDRATIAPGCYATITVSDDGGGIPAEQLPKIFEPFFTTKRLGEGTGLGLSTAYGIVKQSGGFIFADSRVGEGTEFKLYFPSYAAAADVSQPVDAAPRSRGAIPRDSVALLVEDEAPVRAFAARALKMRGIAVIEADCGEAALKALEDPAVKVDLFISDVIMPGIDGPTWIRQALKSRPRTPIILVSGYPEDRLSGSGTAIPGALFLQKPFSLATLTAAVQDLLDGD